MKIAIVALFLLSGCAGLDAAKSRAIDTATEGADRLLADGIFLVCDAPTAGALRRRWGNNQDATEAWRVFCSLSKGAVAP